eukprot:COSAG05_NODE_10923_length_539_cov_0.709091_1_plen_69_part_01
MQLKRDTNPLFGGRFYRYAQLLGVQTTVDIEQCFEGPHHGFALQHCAYRLSASHSPFSSPDFHLRGSHS